jgi:translocation and assembly module TamB
LSITSIEPDYFQVFTSLPVPPSPGNEQFSVNVNVKNKGLTLANILTAQQVTWVDGVGEVNLQVEGKFNANQGKLTEITANGIAIAENATIDAETLPEPLTNVQGRVLFNEDSILVERLQGDFSEGKVVAQGILPIFVPREETDSLMRSWIAKLVMAHNQVARENNNEDSDEDSTDNHLELFNSLIVDLENININLQDLYRGGVSGQVEITGTAFSPRYWR